MNGPIRLTGSQAALPIWMDIARRMLPEQAVPFSPPAGVVARAIDPKTGQLATSQCPEQRRRSVYRRDRADRVL